MTRIKFPFSVLKPLNNFLQKEEVKLKKRRQELEAEDPYADTERLNDNAAIDTDAKEEEGHDRVTALRHEIDKALISVRKTLTKIKVGKFGLCEECNQLINTDRLSVNPTASHCINCAKKNGL